MFQHYSIKGLLKPNEGDMPCQQFSDGLGEGYQLCSKVTQYPGQGGLLSMFCSFPGLELFPDRTSVMSHKDESENEENCFLNLRVRRRGSKPRDNGFRLKALGYGHPSH